MFTKKSLFVIFSLNTYFAVTSHKNPILIRQYTLTCAICCNTLLCMLIIKYSNICYFMVEMSYVIVCWSIFCTFQSFSASKVYFLLYYSLRHSGRLAGYGAVPMRFIFRNMVCKHYLRL